jgi:hypothetical protein
MTPPVGIFRPIERLGSSAAKPVAAIQRPESMTVSLITAVRNAAFGHGTSPSSSGECYAGFLLSGRGASTHTRIQQQAGTLLRCARLRSGFESRNFCSIRGNVRAGVSLIYGSLYDYRWRSNR